MKKTLIFFMLLFLLAVTIAPWPPLTAMAHHSADKLNLWANDLVRQPDDPPYFSLHYRLRIMYFAIQPHKSNSVVFLGDSITYGGDWPKLFPGSPVVNRGIGGDTTLGLLHRLDEVIALKPAKIFLMIGTNDLCYGRPIPRIVANYDRILERFREELPDTQVYIQNVLPFNDNLFPSRGLRKNNEIAKLNEEIFRLATEYRYLYLDVASAFTGPDGRLPAKYTSDGLHLSDAGYLVWREQIRDLVDGSPGRETSNPY
jgi:lysophospholipase L1-like esterase